MCDPGNSIRRRAVSYLVHASFRKRTFTKTATNVCAWLKRILFQSNYELSLKSLAQHGYSNGKSLLPNTLLIGGFFLISGGLILFALIAVAKGDNLKEPRAFAPVLLLRYCAEMIGLLCMIMGLTKVPLSIVGAVTQASPLLVAVGAVIFLKEAVSWRRWSSISIGFLGVVLVIQPWEESLNYAVIWPVVALIAFSIRDLVTRLTPPDIASTSLATFTMVAALPFTTVWVFFTEENFSQQR